MPHESLVGTVAQYDQINGLALVNLSDMLFVGQNIHIKGPHDDFTQTVGDLQLARQRVEVAYPGELVNITPKQPVEERDQIFICE
jgi:putative protease